MQAGAPGLRPSSSSSLHPAPRLPEGAEPPEDGPRAHTRSQGVRDRVGKSPLIGKGQGEPHARPRGEERRLKTTVCPLTCALRASRKEVDGLTVVTDGEVGLTGSVSSLELQRSIAKLVRNRQRTPADRDGLMMLTDDIPESCAY